MPRVIQQIKLELRRGLEVIKTSNPYSNRSNLLRGARGLFGPWTLVFSWPRRSSTYIKTIKFFHFISFSSLIALLAITALAIHPIVFKSEIAEGVIGTAKASETTLTMSTSHTAAGVNLKVSDTNGTFAASTTDELAKFTVTTNNYTGYTLTLSGSDDTRQLLNKSANTTLDSIPTSLSETAFDNSTYNGKWGYKPSKYNSELNIDTYYPGPTTKDSVILDTTTSSNSTANEYTIALAARADYSTASGEYTKTFVLTATANDVAYTISYKDSSGDESVSGSPISPAIITSGNVAGGMASAAALSSNIPTRTGYTFKSWCLGSVSNNGTVCTGTTYDSGADFGIDQTLNNTDITLYAVWETNKYNINFTFETGAKAVAVYSESCEGALIGTATTSSSTVSGLTYGNTYHLCPIWDDTYYFSKWSAGSGSIGTLSSLDIENPTFKIGAGNDSLTIIGQPTTFAKAYVEAGKTQVDGYYRMQDTTTDICGAATVGQKIELMDARAESDAIKYRLYWVAKLPDGKCWMIQNLRLGEGTDSMTLTAEDSSVDGDGFVLKTGTAGAAGHFPARYITDNDPYTDGGGYSYVYDDSEYYCTEDYGCYYNWYTATAGSGKGEDDTSTWRNVDTSQSICPANWRLPKGSGGWSTDYVGLGRKYGYGTESNYVVNERMLISDPSNTLENETGEYIPGFLLGGFYQHDGVQYLGSRGRYWTSNSYTRGRGYAVTFSLSESEPFSVSAQKFLGLSVRCIISGS